MAAQLGWGRARVASRIGSYYAWHLLNRTGQKVALIPRGYAYLFALGDRGRAWLTWADSHLDLKALERQDQAQAAALEKKAKGAAKRGDKR